MILSQLNPKHYLNRAVRHFITSRFEEIPFVVFASFLMTFLVTRFYIYLTQKDRFAFLIDHIIINGVHVHHLNWGIFMLSIVGFWALYDATRTTHRTLAIFYGVGLALAFDEFALWLHLEDNYYAQVSYNAVLFISLVLLNIVYFPQFWKRMGSTIIRWMKPIVRVVRRL